MKQKLVFFIALALALAQGLRAGVIDGGGIVDLTAENFSAYVGQHDSRTITLTYTYSTNPVAISSNGEDQLASTALSGSNNFTAAIWGTDSLMFQITNCMIVPLQTGTQVKITATIEVTYSPTEATGWRMHSATLHLLNQSGVSVASQKLAGQATYLMGDADGDGQVAIADVTALIDYILTGDDTGINTGAADLDGDGLITIADVTTLIDIILGVNNQRLCTFLKVTKTNGTTSEYMINENTKVNIVDGNLRIQGAQRYRNGTVIPYPITVTYSLEDLSQLRYTQRQVTFDNSYLLLPRDNEPTEEYEIETESETLNTMQP